MRFDRLHLIAFGHFSDLELDLAGGDNRIQLIYGPNEAGKSTALRALKGLLFGIPERSPDGFHHPYPRLRIGGCLRRSDGETLTCIRRKGRVNTLRAGDDTAVIEEGRLHAFTGPMDEALFSTMFGMGHGDLVRGGREIVQGGGELGQILFAAGSGLGDIRRIREALAAEAEELFKPAAQKPRLNAAIKRHQELRKEIRSVQLSAGEWEHHHGALEEALSRKAALERELATAEASRNRLSRIRDALPDAARRRDLLRQAETLQDAPLLPSDFPERRREAAESLKLAEFDLERIGRHIAGLTAELEQVIRDPALVAQADAVAACHKEMGAVQRNQSRRPGLQAEMARAAEEITRIQEELPPGMALDQPPRKDHQARLRSLGADYQRLQERAAQTDEAVRHADAERAAIAERIAARTPPPEPDRLAHTLESAQASGDLESRLDTCRGEMQSLHQALAAACAALPGWDGDAEHLALLKVPDPEFLNRTESAMHQAAERSRTAREALESAREQIADLRGRITILEATGRVPTESDLLETRELRETGWQAVRALLSGREENDTRIRAFREQMPMADAIPDAYAALVTKADSLADRLRREADRVAEHARCQGEIQGLEARVPALIEAVEQRDAAASAVTAAWQARWTALGITPGSPPEMRTWLSRHAEIRRQVQQCRELAAEAEQMQRQRDEAVRRIQDALAEINALPDPPPGSLREWIAYARRTLSRLTAERSEWERLMESREARTAEQRAARARQASLAAQREKWHTEWAGLIRPFGLEPDTPPEAVSALMTALQERRTLGAEHQRLAGQLARIDSEITTFNRQVGALTASLAPDLTDAAPEAAVTALTGRLQAARTAEAAHSRLQKQIRESEAARTQARARIDQARAVIAHLCQEAGCAEPAQLPAIEARAAERRQVASALSEVEGRLHTHSGGKPLATFVADLQDQDPDALAPEIARLNGEIGELRTRLSEVDQTIGRARAELARMDGSSRAARLAEDAEAELAAIQQDARRYLQTHLAAAVLDKAMARYRDKHQGPILRHAQEIFSRITLGGFEALRLEFGRSDTPVLTGVRHGGEVVHVEGMSTGTADQLFLALRLAALEVYLERNEPLPLILDDILIHFDDPRAAATLAVLSNLAARTQILFFTHHRHLMELAAAHLGTERLHIHRLNRQAESEETS